MSHVAAMMDASQLSMNAKVRGSGNTVRVGSQKLSAPCRCSAKKQPKTIVASSENTKEQRFKPLQAGVALAASVLLAAAPPSYADLNKFESSQNGEFNLGTAKQLGGIDSNGQDFSGQDLRRSNFTAASLKGANFSNAKLQGAYMIKAVCAKANFEGANVEDVLFDRAVLVEANLKNAIFSRTIFTLSDLRDADIEGADFTDALLDKAQQKALCKYASGTNPVTGESTRASLGCSRGRSGTPSAYMSEDGSSRPAPAFSADDFNAGNQRRASSADSSR